MAHTISRFLGELKRRKVDRAAAVYAVVGLGVIEAANNILPWLFLPSWINQLVLWVVLAGFPAALVWAWVAEVSFRADQGGEVVLQGDEAPVSGVRWTLASVLTPLSIFVLITAAGWFVFARDRGPDLVAERVVVAPFRNLTGVDSLDVVGDIAAHWLSDDLQRAGGVDVVPADDAIQASKFLMSQGGVGSAGRFTDLAQDVRAGIIVTGTYVLERDSLRFRAEIIDVQARRRLEEIGPVSGSVFEPTEAIERLRRRVMGALAAHLQENLGDLPNDFRKAPSYSAYRAFLEGNYHHFRSENQEAIEAYTRAFELDTSFLEPLAHSVISHNNDADFEGGDSVYLLLEPRLYELTPYYQLHLRSSRAGRLGEREEQLRLLRQELELYPGSAAPFSAAWAERNSNHPRRAIELLRTLNPERGSMREWFSYWGTMTAAYHMLGEHEQELQEAQRAEPLYPERLIQPLDKQVIALAALGRVREVHSILDRVETLPAFRSLTPGLVMHHAAMELRAHGHHADAEPIFDRAVAWYRGRPDDEMETEANRYALAQIYYGAERWPEARQIAEGLAMAHPDDTEYQGFLGLVAAHSGDRETALDRDEWLARQRPEYFPSTPIFWRALLAAALGESEGAMTLLREAYDRGLSWGNRDYLYHSFEPLYDLPEYQELMRPKG